MSDQRTRQPISARKPAYAVILVGGKGKRLRPLSTQNRPKAFLSITRDRKTMFAKTVERIRAVLPPDNIVVVANREHAGLVKRDLPRLPRKRLLLEPVSRNTAPAIVLAAEALRRETGDAIMVILPADHYINGTREYLASIERAVGFIEDHWEDERFIVFGVKPSFPATGYGYIKVKGKEPGEKGVYKVERFVEKPDLETAERYVRQRTYLWNSGIFVFKASTLINAMEHFCPEIFSKLKLLGTRPIGSLYRLFPEISIDYAVMEKVKRIYCIKAAYEWHDVGTFESLKTVLNIESRDFVEKDGKVVEIL